MLFWKKKSVPDFFFIYTQEIYPYISTLQLKNQPPSEIALDIRKEPHDIYRQTHGGSEFKSLRRAKPVSSLPFLARPSSSPRARTSNERWSNHQSSSAYRQVARGESPSRSSESRSSRRSPPRVAAVAAALECCTYVCAAACVATETKVNESSRSCARYIYIYTAETLPLLESLFFRRFLYSVPRFIEAPYSVAIIDNSVVQVCAVNRGRQWLM